MTKNSESEAQKAESWQALKAFLIPVTLFLACIGAAAGTFLIYNQESLGWIFIFVSGVTIVLDFIGLIRFQNKWRAQGILPKEESNE
jgi:hypothetical protein